MTRVPLVLRLPIAIALLVVGPTALAAPRDEAIRLAPPDATFVLVVQNARDHVQNILKSPFVDWLPSSTLGKQFASVVTVQAQGVASLFGVIGVSPEQVLSDVVGDAVVFAYTPSPTGEPSGERAVLLIRPGKLDTLARLIERLNAIQTASGEIKSITRRSHNGEEYFERQKSDGGSEFYCYRGGVFAFSGTEPDIKAVIDRDKAAPPVGGQAQGLAAKATKLGVTDSLVVLLVNPRALDDEVRAKVAAAKPQEKAFLERFGTAWKALDAAAIFLTLGKEVELGVAVDFRPGALPPAASGWLTGPRAPPGLWAAIPDNALVAAATRIRAGELVGTIRSVLPESGQKAIDAALSDMIGPVVGRNQLSVVLDALGPDWAVWAEPPTGEGHLPVFVGAVQISPAPGAGKDPTRAIVRAVGFGFQAARVAYNATHDDQIELDEVGEKDGPITILTNEGGFPPGARPSFALRGGYLVVAGSPDAIQRFRPPAGPPVGPGEALIARFSGTATRSYLQAHREPLAGFLSKAGNGPEKDVLKHLDQLATFLEPIDRVDLVTRGTETGGRVALRVKLVKPLK